MTATPASFSRARTRVPLVLGVSVVLLLSGTGVATARWITAATTTLPVAAGELTTGVTGTAELGAENIDTDGYTTPVALILDTPSPVPVDYTLEFATQAGTLDPAEIALAVWEPAGGTCPATAPEIGTEIGTLMTPPPLPTNRAVDEPSILVCAATRFIGTLSESSGRSLTASPILTARLTTGTWTATARGDDVIHTISSNLTENPTGGLAGDPVEEPVSDHVEELSPDPAEEPANELPDAPAEDTARDLPEGPLENPMEDPTNELAPVTDLMCTDQDELPELIDGDIKLVWDPVAGATGYRILVSTGRILEVTDPTVELDTDDLGYATWIDVQALSSTGQSSTTRHEVHVRVNDDLEETLHCN